MSFRLCSSARNGACPQACRAMTVRAPPKRANRGHEAISNHNKKDNPGVKSAVVDARHLHHSRAMAAWKGRGGLETGGTGPMSLAWNAIRSREWAHLAFCVVGVVGSLLAYGVLQERIMAEPYGQGQMAEKWEYSLFLVLCNRLTSCAIAVFGLVKDNKLEEIKPVAPLISYMGVSLSNVVATFCQYEALRYVSFPVQTLGKCAKMLPVMVWGIIIMRKRYTVKDFLLALSVTGGCTLFMLTGDVKSKASAHVGNAFAVYGLLLMLGYLGFDGFTSTFQDKLFKGYQMTTYNQILYTTLCSSVLSSLGLVSSGQFPKAIAFIQRHPEALSNIMALSAAASVGSLFISYTIKTFGALLFATIMTTRQFLSILLSCFIFLHPLSLGQWAGSVVVFGSLYYQGFSKKEKPKAASEPTHADKVAASKLPNDEESTLNPLLRAGPQEDATAQITTLSPNRS